MIHVGQNSEIRNLVINLDDSLYSGYSTAIYSLDKSNVSINECIFASNTTTINLNYIYMNGGYNNSITNCKILNTNILNISDPYTSCIGFYIEKNTPRIINNNIDIPISFSRTNSGIYLLDCSGTVSDKVYIENLTCNINYLNTNLIYVNQGIYSWQSSFIIKNSDIEVTNNHITF